MPRLSAAVRFPIALGILITTVMFSGALVLVLAPCIWIREAVGPVMQSDEMDWLD
jgi:hypothetical protein